MSRESLSKKLHTICPNVYFISGNNGSDGNITYPAITYYRSTPNTKRANNTLYLATQQYKVTYMDRATRDVTKDFLETFNHCSVDSVYVSDGIHHQVFTIYE